MSNINIRATLDIENVKRNAARYNKEVTQMGVVSDQTGQIVSTAWMRVKQAMGGIAIGVLAHELYAFANAFDKSMKEVSTLSDTVASDLDSFKQSVLNMTTEIPVGADAAAKALYQIVSAGHDGANGLHVLEVASKAAVGGVTETVTAADAITTVLNAYKMNASDAASISDQLFTTVRLGKTTFGELGQHIATVVPIAASFGIETEQILAAVATLTKSGTPTAQAMTQIRTSIIEATKVLGDGYFKTHSFQEGLQEIATKAGGSEAKLRELIPSVEAMNAVLGLTGINAQMAASDLGQLNNSLGASEKAYKKMVDQATAQVTMLKNNMLAKFHDIGDGAVDMVSSIAKFLNSDGIFNKTALDDLIATMGVLIATVGIYKAQLIVANALSSVKQNLRYTAEIAELEKLLIVKQRNENQDLQKLVTNKKLSADQAAKIASLRAEINEKLKAMQADATAAAAEVRNAKAVLISQNQSLNASRAKITSLRLEQSEYIVTGNAVKANSLQEQIYAERKQYSATKTAIKTQQDALNSLQLNAQSKNLAVNSFQQNINNASTLSGAKAKNLLSIATTRLGKAFHSLKVAFMSNPFGLVLTGVTLLASAFMMFNKEAEEAKSTLEEFNDEMDKQTEKYKNLVSVVQDSNKADFERMRALEELQKMYPSIFKNMDIEAVGLANQTKLTNDLVKAERERQRAQLEKDIEKTEWRITGRETAISDIEKSGGVNISDRTRKLKKELEEFNETLKEQKGIYSALTREIASQEAAEKKVAEATAGRAAAIEKTVKWYDEQIKKLKTDQEKSTTSTGFNSLQKQIDDLEKEKAIITGGSKTDKKNAEDRKKVIEDINKEILSLEEENEIERQDRKIAQMKEGADKEIAQIELDYQQKRAAIKALSDKWEKEQGHKLTTEQNIVISAAYSEARETRAVDTDNVSREQQKQEEHTRNEYLKEYGTYQQKKASITEEYAKKIADAQTKGEGDTLRKQQEAELSDLDKSMMKKSDLWVRLFSDAGNYTTKYIEQIVNDTQQLVDYIDGVNGVEIPVGFNEDQIKALKEEPDQIKAILEELKNKQEELNERDPFGSLIDGFKDYKKATDNVRKAQEELDRIEKTGTASKKDLDKATRNLTNAQNERQESLSKMSAATNDIGEKGGELVNAGNQIVGMITALGGSVSETVTATLNGMGQIFSSLESIDITKPFSLITGAIGVVTGIGETIGGIFGLGKEARNEKYNREIEANQKRLDGLEKEMSELQKETASSYSGKKVAAINEEDENLRKQNELLQQQINAEYAKKDSDYGTIDQWNESIEANNILIEENKALRIDAVMGADIQSAIDDFANKLTDAWAQGDSSAKASKDIVKDMIKQMINEAMKMDIAAPMAKLREMMTGFYADGVLTEEEQRIIEEEAERMANDLDQKYGSQMERLNEEDPEELKRQTGGITETITEKTASESMGIWRGHYDATKRNGETLSGLRADYMRTIKISNDYLNNIANNTQATAKNTAVLSDINIGIASMDKRLKTMEANSGKRFAK